MEGKINAEDLKKEIESGHYIKQELPPDRYVAVGSVLKSIYEKLSGVTVSTTEGNELLSIVMDGIMSTESVDMVPMKLFSMLLMDYQVAIKVMAELKMAIDVHDKQMDAFKRQYETAAEHLDIYLKVLKKEGVIREQKEEESGEVQGL